MLDFAGIKSKTSLICGIVCAACDVKQMRCLGNYFAAMEHTRRYFDRRTKNLRILVVLFPQQKLDFSSERRTFFPVVVEHRMNHASGSIPPINLQMMIVPSLYRILLHHAVTPLPEAFSEKIVGAADNFPEKAASIDMGC